MRILDHTWTDLSLGYQAVQSLQGRLETEFGRAVDVGYKRKYRRELTEWQKKRRVFFVLVALVPLSIIALCVSAYYYREVACVLAWWLLTALLVFLTAAAAGWSYIRQMVSGRPVPQRATVSANLIERWWDSLAPKILAVKARDERKEADFLSSLYRLLPDDWLAVHNLFLSAPARSSTDLLLLGPSGIWVFEVVHWSGDIAKNEGVWMQLGRKGHHSAFEEAPDDEWLRQRDEILTTLQGRVPHLSWVSNLIHGGVVFSNPKVRLDKNEIQGNTAPYGLASAWEKRLPGSAPDERFTLQVRLELLDALFTSTRNLDHPDVEYASSRDEADQLYAEFAGRLREHVEKLVK